MGATTAYVALSGADMSTFVRKGSISIEDNLNEAPNTCSLIWDGSSPPVGGQTIAIALGTPIAFHSPGIIFAGSVVTVTKLYEGKTTNPAWHITAQDGSFILNKRRPIGNFSGSATAVINQLVSTYAPTFTTNNVPLALPTIAISFNGSQDFSGCMTSICNLIKASWLPDYYNDIWVKLS